MDDQINADPWAGIAELKQQIAGEIRQHVGQLKDPEDRFNTIASLLLDGWDEHLAKQAFAAAKEIPDIEHRVRELQYLLSLMPRKEDAVPEPEADPRSDPQSDIQLPLQG